MRLSENPEWESRSTSFFNVADLPDPSIQYGYGIAAISISAIKLLERSLFLCDGSVVKQGVSECIEVAEDRHRQDPEGNTWHATGFTLLGEPAIVSRYRRI
jgi:hypothetical protein